MMKNRIAVACIVLLFTQNLMALPKAYLSAPVCNAEPVRDRAWDQEPKLVPPILLKRDALEAGNPLATYAAMLELEPQYLKSKIFADFYRETRFNFEEFMGVPLAGVQAMSLPSFRRRKSRIEIAIPVSYQPEDALSVIQREARKTRLVIFGEEHHLPQTRSLYEPLLRLLWAQGYRYFAAETFTDQVMSDEFKYPDFQSGYYTLDPVFASAVRTAKELGYKLIAYETNERGPAGDGSFRDRTQAENIKARIFDRDPQAKVFIIAGRLHASEEPAPDGWTPMASVLKRLTGINPLTLFAPTMSQRLTSEEEDPYYRFATSRGLVKKPAIFVNKTEGRFLSFENYCDAYIFWPRIRIKEGRPDWMARDLKRKSVRIPSQLLVGRGMRLVQAHKEGEPASAIPIDQVLIDDQSNPKVLMLPKGKYSLRTIDRETTVIREASVIVH
jgi:hypothetical protein